MSAFETPVEQHMVSSVHAIEPGASLADAHERLIEHNISSLPVLANGELVGVITRSDLLRIGRRHAGTHGLAKLLTLPTRSVGDEMTRDVVAVSPDTSAAVAAKTMTKKHIHRVYVTRDGQLAGVFSTRDLMVLIRDNKANVPISDLMTKPIMKVRADEPISLATERLEKAHISGLLVVEDDWPVGIFTQVEALESRDVARDTSVDEVMNPALVCLPHDTRIHRAAGQAITMRLRRVVAVKYREAVGILSGLNFARFVAG